MRLHRLQPVYSEGCRLFKVLLYLCQAYTERRSRRGPGRRCGSVRVTSGYRSLLEEENNNRSGCGIISDQSRAESDPGRPQRLHPSQLRFSSGTKGRGAKTPLKVSVSSLSQNVQKENHHDNNAASAPRGQRSVDGWISKSFSAPLKRRRAFLRAFPSKRC